MKIMKERKTLSHNELVELLIKKVNFGIENTMVKQRIESLIEKDYLKRSVENAAQYEYVA